MRKTTGRQLLMQSPECKTLVSERTVILHFDTGALESDSLMLGTAERIICWREAGYTPLVLLSCPDGYDEKILQEFNPAGKAEYPAHLRKRERELLSFCPGIIKATTISHMLRTRGCNSIALTGFQAGLLRLCEDEHCVFFDTGKTGQYLHNYDVVIVSGLQVFCADGTLQSLGRQDLLKLSEFLASKRECRIEIPDGEPLSDSPEGMAFKEIQDSAVHTEKNAVGLLLSGEHTLEKGRVVSGIITVLNVHEFRLDFPDSAEKDVKRLRILDALSDRGVSLDMINICYDSLYFIVTQNLLPAVKEVLREENTGHTSRGGLVKLSLTGVGMKGTPGVMAQIYSALESAQVEVLRNTDSHITISCVIEEEDLPSALEALMEKFNLERKDIIYENRYE